jgi:glycosyltransferase involved in cell wall biosynthesis
MTVACPADIYHPHAGVYAEIQDQAVASRSTSTAANFKRLMLRFSGKQRTLLTLERKAVRPSSRGGPFRILSLCPMITDHFARHYGTERRPHHQLVELPNPLMRPLGGDNLQQTAQDRAWFRGHYGLKPDDRVAIFVGHDFRRKGLRYAIEAVAKTASWKLLVVGLGKAREYVELANALRIGDISPDPSQPAPRRILFVGPTKEMDRIYAAADALLLPTFYDSFGLVVIEALSHGLPIISTESLGAAYLVKDHHVGAIVPTPRDTDLMAQCLTSLPAPGTKDRDQLADIARAASTEMLPEKYIHHLLALYQQVQKEKLSEQKK